MPRVQFYHNAENPETLACELATRAWASGRRVAIRAPDTLHARQVSQLLWAHDPQSFIPNVMVNTALAAETPIVIGSADSPCGWPHGEILLNLAPDVPPDFESFRMLIEIIGQDEASKAPARARWKHYKQHDHPLQAFDAVSRTAL